MTPSIAPVLEAVALAAAVRMRWPELDMGRTGIIPTNASVLVMPVPINRSDFFYNELPEGEPVFAFTSESIYLNLFWTGSQRVWLGYGRESDVLAVRLPGETREQLAG